jgi:hypothetical protein
MSEADSEKSEVNQVILYEEVTEAFAAIREGLKDTQAVDDLKKRIGRIVARANEAVRIGQTGLSRDLMEAAAGLVVEQQVAAMGYGRWLEEAAVRQVVEQTAKEHRLSMCHLSEFPRIIPNDVQALITRLRDFFSQFIIVFTNPMGETVKNKDPVLFGVIRAYPNRLYYITDWIDEYCDLTIDKFLTLGSEALHKQWAPTDAVVEPTDDDLHALVRHVRDGRVLKPIERTWIGKFVDWLMSRSYRGVE